MKNEKCNLTIDSSIMLSSRNFLWNNSPLQFLGTGLILLLFFTSFSACQSEPDTKVIRTSKKVLLVSNPNSVQDSINAIILEELMALRDEGQFELDTSLNFNLLDEDTLQSYSALFLLDIEEDSLKVWHRADIERYAQSGSGVLVFDDKKVTPYLWHWYDKLLNDKQTWREDTVFFFNQFDYDGGKTAVFQKENWSNYPGQNLKNDILNAVAFAIGDNSYDYALATNHRAPNFNRYSKVILDDDIYEPMEMVILPNLKVLFLERRGKMKLYDPYNKRTLTITEFDVCIDGNYEDGLTGMALDPNYGKDNHWLYVYYSPSSTCDNPNQYLSRFVFKDDSLHWHTEKVVLEVEVQRETCCHSGGGVEFGPDGLLYLSTGDNTSSKESDGFTPTDERPGRGPFDAQKSSSNTHDLRGKILRIRPEADGTYSIPEGNLFAKDGSEGRPEIYTMGCRNPFRFSIDPETNWLYWGDVGPDGGVDGRYGPQSYDEWNQAKEAGNYGWPYFVGNNFAYPDRNFETDEVGDPLDPAHPINDSPNNFGAKELPPAQPAWIWYPYGESEEFPLLGIGSRSSMAGPFYNMDNLLPLTKVNFPKYYEGKLFIYEWARSWIQVLTVDKTTGDLLQMEPFWPDMEMSKPIEVEFGPEGAMYILEYGRQYFMNNPDAVLSRIEFTEGNRAPIAKLAVENPNGSAPHEVHFSASQSYDFDEKDSLRYEWHFTDAENVQGTGVETSFTFKNTGIFKPLLKVIDQNGAVSTLETTVKIGNAPPEVNLQYSGNHSFFFAQNETSYEVKVTDPEDAAKGSIDIDRILVNASYVSDNEYLKELSEGKHALPEGPLQYVEGIRLIRGSDCLSCHEEEKKNIGPSYREVAQKYKNQPEVVSSLAGKIIRGGGGVWGDKLMAGHPQLKQTEAEAMVQYILSLEEYERLPAKGNFDIQMQETGGYVLSAAYKDGGANGIESITGRDLIILRSPRLQAEDYSQLVGGIDGRFGVNNEFTQVYLQANGFLKYDNIDLKGVRTVTFKIKHYQAGKITLRAGSKDGEVVAAASLSNRSSNGDWVEVKANVSKTGVHDLYLVFEPNGGQGQLQIDWMVFRN